MRDDYALITVTGAAVITISIVKRNETILIDSCFFVLINTLPNLFYRYRYRHRLTGNRYLILVCIKICNLEINCDRMRPRYGSTERLQRYIEDFAAYRGLLRQGSNTLQARFVKV